MVTLDLVRQIIATYQRHGWTLRQALLSSETRAVLANDIFNDASIVESDFDALWFARASHANREAWELRLLGEQQYALFEAFESDETEEDREEARREIENRMRGYARR